MRIRDLFYETFSAIQANRGRSLLTILGIVIGIAAVISMTALIDGVKASLVGELGLSQSRTVMIDCWPGREVTMDDIDALEAGMSDDYEFITAASYNSGTVSNGVTQEDCTFLGVEPEYVESDWDSLFAGLDAGRYDIVCNGVEVTDERAMKYDFSTPYGYIRTALIVRGDREDIASFEDLAGKRTANSISSTYMLLAESYGATAMGVDTLDETLAMVLSGRADATLNAEVSFYDYMNVHPDADFKLVAQTEDASHVAIPLRKGDASATLLDAINTAIDELRADGTLKELSEKYFGQDISAEN